jgi:soluble lytic murein transglycosylase-like protein
VSTSFNSSAKQKKLTAVNLQAAPPARSIRVTPGTPAAPVEKSSKAGADQAESSNSPDPESQRILDEFVRLREDASARRAFYNDLLGAVERVRSGIRNENLVEEKPVSFQPATNPSGKISIEPVSPPHLPEVIQPQDPMPATKPPAPPSSLGPTGNLLDQAAYQRVVHWAKVNNAPVSLALGVAWMESHLNTNAPRGTSGEVGMYQIMPERCRLEGWPSKRLSEPEFNAWMGTMLLARYYREEGSVARAAAKYVAGPGVFNKEYSKDMWAYINWYATTVDIYASYFSRRQS